MHQKWDGFSREDRRQFTQSVSDFADKVRGFFRELGRKIVSAIDSFQESIREAVRYSRAVKRAGRLLDDIEGSKKSLQNSMRMTESPRKWYLKTDPEDYKSK